MSKLAILVTILIELMLLTTRILSRWLKHRDRYGSERRPSSAWLILPYDFKVDWCKPVGKRNSDPTTIKGRKPPKFRNLHSEDV